MRIVKFQEFLRLPAGTIFTPYRYLNITESLQYKDDSIKNSDGKLIDFFYNDLGIIDCHDTGDLIERSDAMLEFGESFPINYNLTREGLYDDNNEYLIYELSDLKYLQLKIDEAIKVLR